MNNMLKKTFKVFAFLVIASAAISANAGDIVGSWCFYEQEYNGEKTTEKVNLLFEANGNYTWQEGGFRQTGTWSLDDDNLEMSDVGSHTVLSVSSSEMLLKRFTLMKFRRGSCN